MMTSSLVFDVNGFKDKDLIPKGVYGFTIKAVNLDKNVATSKGCVDVLMVDFELENPNTGETFFKTDRFYISNNKESRFAKLVFEAARVTGENRPDLSKLNEAGGIVEIVHNFSEKSNKVFDGTQNIKINSIVEQKESVLLIDDGLNF